MPDLVYFDFPLKCQWSVNNVYLELDSSIQLHHCKHLTSRRTKVQGYYVSHSHSQPGASLFVLLVRTKCFGPVDKTTTN